MRSLNIKYISNRPNQEHLSFKIEPLESVELPNACCLDLETTGLIFNKNKILMVILGNSEIQYVIDYCSVDKGLLKEKMSKVQLFIGHNLSFDLPFLMYNKFDFDLDTIYDTMETELTLVKGTAHSVSLKNTVKRRLNIDTFDKGITIEFTLMNGDNPFFDDRHIKYAAEDILYLEDLTKEQLKFIVKYNQQELSDYNNNMVIVVSKMKVDGIFVNKDKWMKLYHTNLAKVDQLEVLMDNELARLGLKQRKKRVKERTLQADLFGIGTDVCNKNLDNINYSSSDQIKDIFKFFGQPIPTAKKKKKGGTYEDTDTTGIKELEEYILNRPKSILKDFLLTLLGYKVLKKRISSFGKEFMAKHLDDFSKVHPSYLVNRTATGRLASRNPNAQNIPRVKDYRECFEAEGDNLLWTCDLGSAELRILASLADDKKMKELYNNGEDLHSYLATPVYRYIFNDNTVTITKKTHPDFRNSMKTINFGIAYGASGSKVAKVLDISKQKGEVVLKIMRGEIPSAFEFLEKQEHTAQTVGKIIFEEKWNQVRYFEAILKGGIELTPSKKAGVGREGKNVALQGINSQMIKLAMVNIYRYICERSLKSKIVLSVHDELVIEFPPEEIEHTDIFEKIMIESSNYFLDGVEMEVEKNIGKCWDK